MSLILEGAREKTCLKAGDFIFVQTEERYHSVLFSRPNKPRILVDGYDKLVFPRHVGGNDKEDRFLIVSNIALIVNLCVKIARKGSDADLYELVNR